MGPDKSEVIEGVLVCSCGLNYPIVNSIPRMLRNAVEVFPDFFRNHGLQVHQECFRSQSEREDQFDILLRRTQRSFGYQWTTFSAMVCDFRENFLNYLGTEDLGFFQGRLGMDVGCGFGRHIINAAQCGAEMVGVDLSRAIDAAHENTKNFSNIHLVQANIYELPFAEKSYDFIYSVGVIHHLPDPERGLQAIAPFLKPGGQFFIWVYSDKRRISNFFLESVRKITKRLPYALVKQISFFAALSDLCCFILPYKIVRNFPGLRHVVEKFTFPRIKTYSKYPFQVSYADWFDRLAAPVRHYYGESEVRDLMCKASLSQIKVDPTGYYGWRACGVRES
jgi:SAM-dependent methyltransferase